MARSGYGLNIDPYGAQSTYGAYGEDSPDVPGGTTPTAPVTAPVTPPTTGAVPRPPVTAPPVVPPRNPTAPIPPTVTPPAAGTDNHARPYDPSFRTNPDYIRSQIAVWAQMPGADPSLASNPDYWVQQILAKGGLGPDNQQFWQDASVGPNAFFRNPNRESTTTAQPNAFLTTTRDALLARLRDLNQPIDATNPAVAGAANAYRLTGQRQLDRTKKQLAEAAFAGSHGGPMDTNALTQSQAQASEQEGQNEAAYTGNLVNSAELNRQSLLNQLLGVSSGQGLQEELAGGQLGFNYAQLQASMNRDALLQLLMGL